MNAALKFTVMVITVTAINYLASFLVPVPPSWSGTSPDFHYTLANSVAYTFLHAGAGLLFISGLGAYKAALRSAYVKIAIGVTLVGAGLAQVILLNIFNLIQTPWVQYGGVMIPFVVAGLSIYFGIRQIAKLIGVRSPLTNTWIVFPAVIIGIIITSLAPHTDSPLAELIFDIANAISVGDVLLYTIALVLVLQIKSQIGAHYGKATRWMAIGLTGSVIITSFVLIETFMLGRQPASYLLDSIVIIGGLLYLKAGYTFARTKEL